MDGQRAFNHMCRVYGSDPEGHADWAGQDGLPEDRAAKCPAEYEKLSGQVGHGMELDWPEWSRCLTTLTLGQPEGARTSWSAALDALRASAAEG